MRKLTGPIFALAFLASIAGCASDALTNKPVTMIQLTGLEWTPEKITKRITGDFALKNSLNEDLCLMADVVENSLSPDVQIRTRDHRGRFQYANGLPFPRKTQEILRIGARNTARFRRAVAYSTNPAFKRGSVTQMVEVRGWLCDSGRVLHLQSDAFEVTADERL